MIARSGALSTLRVLLALGAGLVAGCVVPVVPETNGTAATQTAPFPRPDEAFTLSDGASLPVRVWRPPAGLPPRAVILALHGFNDSRDAWELPAARFAAERIAVFAPDQRGFGAAPGRGTWPGGDRLVADAIEMAAQLRARYPATPLYLMGESMGGAVLLAAAARPDLPPNAGIILLAPAVWGRQEMGVVLSSGLWVAANLAPHRRLTGLSVPRRLVASDNREALLRLANDPLTLRASDFSNLKGLVDLMDEAQAAAPRVRLPMLVMYGGRDQLVPPVATAAAWQHLPPAARRALYPNGYHLLLRDRDRASPTGDILAWIDDKGAWLPSGADIAASAWVASHGWESDPPAYLPTNLDTLASSRVSQR